MGSLVIFGIAWVGLAAYAAYSDGKNGKV